MNGLWLNFAGLRIRFIITFLLILIFSFYRLNAERLPLFYIGGYGAYNMNTQKVGFSSLPGIDHSDITVNQGNGAGYSYGGLFQTKLTGSLFLEIRFGFSDYYSKISEIIDIGQTNIKDKNPPQQIRFENVDVDHTLETIVLNAGFEPSIGYNLFWGLNLFAGVKAAYLYGGRFNQKETIIEPKDVVFLNDEDFRFKYSDIEIPEKNKIQFWGLIGASWDINLGNYYYFVPEVRFYQPLTNLSKKLDWSVSSLQGGLSLRLPLFPGPEIKRDTIYYRDTATVDVIGLKEERISLLDTKKKLALEETDDYKIYWAIYNESYLREVPKPVPISSSIKIEGVRDDGTREANPTIIIEEVEYVKETIPLLPYVFFKEGSSDLMQSGVNILSQSETSLFSDDSLKPKPLVAYIELLNIIGFRMKKYPDAILTITGCNNNFEIEKGNDQLSIDRASQVKDYFVGIWRINPNRILVSSRNLPQFPASIAHLDGRQENQRVEFSSNDENLLSHIMLKSFTRKTKIPKAEIFPAARSGIPMKDWEIVLNQGNAELRSYSGSGDPQKVIQWSVMDEPIPEYDSEVIARLTARDSLLQLTSAETACKVLHKHLKLTGDDLKGGTLVEKYYVIAHFGKSDIISNQMGFFQHIKSRIKPNSIVTISGFADRTGNQQINRNLAQKRVDQVQSILNVAPGNLLKNPVGSDILLYDNDLPEGRCYSRTIQVIIETWRE